MTVSGAASMASAIARRPPEQHQRGAEQQHGQTIETMRRLVSEGVSHGRALGSRPVSLRRRLKRIAGFRDRGACGAGRSPARTERTAMPTLCRAYVSEEDARAAVDRLLRAGITGAEVQVLMGAAEHDGGDAPVGGFAGATTPDAETVGSYAGMAHSGRDAMGAFAGDAGRQRRGGFSDVDRETVTTHGDGVTRVRIASHHDLERMLVEAGLDRATAASDVAALHAGRVLVLVRSPMGVDDFAAVIDGRR
jgi:hypothetical protein